MAAEEGGDGTGVIGTATGIGTAVGAGPRRRQHVVGTGAGRSHRGLFRVGGTGSGSGGSGPGSCLGGSAAASAPCGVPRPGAAPAAGSVLSVVQRRAWGVPGVPHRPREPAPGGTGGGGMEAWTFPSAAAAALLRRPGAVEDNGVTARRPPCGTSAGTGPERPRPLRCVCLGRGPGVS